MSGGGEVKVFLDLRSIRPNMTGVGVAARLLMMALAERKQALTLTGIFLKGCLPGDLQSLPVKALETPVDYEHHPTGEWWLNFSLPQIVRDSQADIFHGASFLVPWRKTSFRKIVTIHDLIAFHCPETYPFKFRHYIRWITRLSLRSADRIIVPSTHTKEDVINYFNIGEEKIDVVPHYTHPRFRPFAPEEAVYHRRALGLPEPYILCVGTLEKRKNHVALLKAYEILKKRTQILHKLLLIGPSAHDSESLLRLIKESPVASDIIHWGWKKIESLDAIYACADLFVLPSFYEGFGLPVLEAMASGVPVICSNTTSLPEVVGDAGRIVSPDSPTDLADAMEDVLTHQDRLKILREKGLLRASEFTAERTASLVLSSYDKALSM